MFSHVGVSPGLMALQLDHTVDPPRRLRLDRAGRASADAFLSIAASAWAARSGNVTIRYGGGRLGLPPSAVRIYQWSRECCECCEPQALAREAQRSLAIGASPDRSSICMQPSRRQEFVCALGAMAAAHLVYPPRWGRELRMQFWVHFL